MVKNDEFAELDLFEEDYGVRVPPRSERPVEQQQSSAEPAKPAEKFHFVSPDRTFTEEARGYAEEQGAPVPFVPFMSYWPTYRHMTAPQLAWYFHWRSEVRNHRYPDTDLSYIFVYIYELINGVGWQEPEAGYEQLDKLLVAYGDQYPQLGRYLGEWIFDFALVHDLKVPLNGVIARLGGRLPGELLDMELKRGFHDPSGGIGFDLLMSLSDYELRSSKFYQGNGRLDLEFYIPRVISLVDAFLQKSGGARLIERFAPGEEQLIQRYLFRNAVYDTARYGTTITLSVMPVRSCLPLRAFITQILRFTENKLRELRQFKGRLRDTGLEPDIGALIGRYLDREFRLSGQQRPAVVIDQQKLAALQKDTDEVRDMLTISENEMEKRLAEEERITEVELAVISGTASLLPQVSYAQSGGQSGDDKPDVSPMNPAAANEEIVQNASAEYTGEEQIAMATVKTSAGGEPVHNPTSVVWDTEGLDLDADWRTFAGLLDECQLKVLYTLKSPGLSPSLHEVAEEYGTLPTLVIDQINDLAMETIGDLVIDGERLVEDYLQMFEQLKGGFASR